MIKSFLFIFAAALAPSSAFAAELAKIDGEPLTTEALAAAAETLGPRRAMTLSSPTLRRQYLEQLIDARLAARAATAAGLEESAEFKAAIAEAKARILSSLYVERYVASRSDEPHLRAYFAAHKLRFSSREVHALHVALPDEAAARQVLAEARAAPGGDFAALVAKHAKPGSAESGGDLGWFRRGRMIPEFEAAAFATPPGSVHPQVVRTQFGWHVVKIVAARGTDEVRFDAVRAAVKDAAEADARAQALAELRAKAKVAIDEAAVRDARF